MGLSILPTVEADLPDLAHLWNDPRVMRWVRVPDGLGIDDAGLDAWFAALQRSRVSRHFVVRDDAGGFCGELFYRLDAEHRRAELDIKLVPESQGRGVATAALSWLVDRVFAEEPAIDAVWVEPWPENAAARALYARCGLAETSRPADLGDGPSYWERRRA